VTERRRLVVKDLVVRRGGLTVVHGASLAAEGGAVTVLLGSNGAGKTTLLESISGAIPVHRGTIELDGERLDRTRPVRRTERGIAHVEQGRTIFGRLTVEENLQVAARPEADEARVFALFPELEQRRDVRAGLLSGGEQQMVVIARALMGRPTVILLDEMSLGLAPIVVRRLLRTVRELADEGMAVLLVEQFAALALGIGDAAYVLQRGRLVFEGTCRELREDPGRLRSAYLGDPSQNKESK
jgi:branched-chain amino acid transport system ATP-binding protein